MKRPGRPALLPLTGERTAPGIWHENYWFRRHQVVYAACPDWVDTADGLVVDAGCGEGYGVTALGSAVPGARVLGIDYDASTVAHAHAVHGSRICTLARAALTAIPLPDGVADATVSLQVLEHIWTPGAYVAELCRVTRAGGTLVLSTPNRLTFSPGLGRGDPPPGLFHQREYDAAELVEEVTQWVGMPAELEVHTVRHAARLREWEGSHGPLSAAQLATAPDDWPEDLRAVVTGVTTDDFEIEDVAAGTLDDGSLDDALDLVVVVRLR